MNGTKLTEEQRTIIRLERCIRDFKAYDKERKAYVRDLESRNAELESRVERLQIRCDGLAERIEMLIDAYDHADPMKDGSERRAYVKRLLDQILSDEPGRLTSRRLANIESALAREVVNLRKGNETLSSRNKFLEKENNELYNLLKNRP